MCDGAIGDEISNQPDKKQPENVFDQVKAIIVICMNACLTVGICEIWHGRHVQSRLRQAYLLLKNL